jgi:hypothetical protein
MFDRIKNGSEVVFRCRVTDREWISRDTSDREKTERVAEQLQRSLLFDKLGFDPEQPKSIDEYRVAYQAYEVKRGQ